MIYITHYPTGDGQKVIRDIARTTQYGDFKFIVPDNCKLNLQQQIDLICKTLVRDFNESEDYLLFPPGSPAVGVAVGACLQGAGIEQVQVLVWDKLMMAYRPTTIELRSYDE